MTRRVLSAVAVTAAAIALSMAMAAVTSASAQAATNGTVRIGGIAAVCPDPKDCPSPG